MTPTPPEFALSLERTLSVSRAAVWRCWTEPDLLCQWFCPKPWGVSRAEIELKSGGRFFTHMVGPNGEQVPNAGVFLQVEPGCKLVFTDAFVSAWVPSGKAFMVGEITLADAPGGGTLYRARSLHWSEADMQQHEAMGFHEGWAAATRQLEQLAATL